MPDLPEILREYRAKIVPAEQAEPLDQDDLGRRTKFGGKPDEIQRQGQSASFVQAAATKCVS